MSDTDVEDQPAGTTQQQTTAQSRSTSKRGHTQIQETETTELLETDISTVIDTTTAPTADQDVR